MLRDRGLCYLSMECRTGKTLTALVAAEKFGAASVLFITKKKAIESVKSDYALLNPSYRIEVINYESAHKSAGTYDLVILDEAHSLGAFPRPGERTKQIRRICVCKPVIYLSGTPSPESYSQLYHQFWCSSYSPWRDYTNFYKWARKYVDVFQRIINGFRITDYSHARKEMIDADVRDLFIDYSQEDAGFQIDINEHFPVVEMLESTGRMLHELRRDKVLETSFGTILADTPATMMGKVHQLSSGTVITEDGVHHIIDRSKARYIKEKFAGQKIAIFYVYVTELELLREEFPDYTDSPEEFQACDGKVFISQVRRAREGVRLDSADALIFYNLEFSYLSYEQGRNRLVSKERSTPAEVYFLQSDCGIEGDIIKAVRGKRDFTWSWYMSKARFIPKSLF